MLSTLWNDLRYAARALSRTPGFAAAAVATIALGVGVNSGIFTVLNGILFRDLPAPNAHELVSIRQTVDGGELTGTSGLDTFTMAEYRAYRDRAETLSVLAHGDPRETTLGGETPQKVFGAIVSCNYFAVLGVPPALGRALTAEDCAPGADPVVVLAHGIWTTAFAADPGILGRTVELARRQFTVVGVAAAGTYGTSPLKAAYFAPLSAEPLLYGGRSRFEDDRHRWLYLIGRRAGGTGLSQVRAELDVLAAQIDQAEPGRSTTLAIERARPATLPGHLRPLATGAAAVLMTSFGLILLIACANVANLLLARATARSREIGIRLSLGASRGRIVRQLLTESVLISVAGGALGSMLALWSFQALVMLALPGMVPPEVPGVVLDVDLSPDYRVLSFAIALTLATGVVFGLAPALHASNPDLNAVIKQDTAGAGAGRGGGRLRGTLVGVQVALCMVLMIATGLLLRGLQATYTIDPGFAYRGVAHLSFGTDGTPPIQDQSLIDEIAALPGVTAVASAMQTPLGESRVGVAFRLPDDGDSELRFAEMNQVTPGFFSLLEIPILRGRTFTEAEAANLGTGSGRRPAIVTESTARNLWGERDPIGQTLIRGDTTLEVVGVAADARVSTLGRIDPVYIYELGGIRGALLVKSRADFETTASGIHAIVRSRDPSLAFRVLPLEGNLAWWRGVSGTITTLGAGLGVLALALASVGIYGVVAYAVTRRHREIGIRMALGARTLNVLGLILRQTLRPVAVGAVFGIAAAVAGSGVLSSVLFGVSPADPFGLAGAVLLVLGVALTAGILAARPATRVEPTATLRHD